MLSRVLISLAIASQMPQWSTGYYGILNLSRYLSNFLAADGAGHALGVGEDGPQRVWFSFSELHKVGNRDALEVGGCASPVRAHYRVERQSSYGPI